MRNVFIAVGLLVAIALIAGLLGYRAGCDPALHEAARQGDAMTWLKRDQIGRASCRERVLPTV